MAQATSSLALLPVNELPPPPSFEKELAKALEPTKAKPARKTRKSSGGRR
jgi:hypothetical protein